MKRKTIKSILANKIKSWTDSIEDVGLAKEVNDNVIVTGGALTSLLLNDKPKDFDIYIKNRNTLKKLASYYIDKYQKSNDGSEIELQDLSLLDKSDDGYDPRRLKIYIPSKGVASENNDLLTNPMEDVYDEVLENEEDQKPKYRPIFLSANAITLTNKIQIVVRFWGNPEEIHENFDFVHCMNYWTSWDNRLELKPEALESILGKDLVYRGSKYPICSLIRARKFIRRGWTINAGQYLKMCFQISNLDLTDIKVLEDQLVGVDSAYFNTLIEALKGQHSKDTDFSICSAYVSEIIDRIF